MKFGEKTREVRTAAVALLTYVACAVLVLQHLWADPQGRMFADNTQDQIFFEWVLTHAARFFTHGDNPFFTDQLNAPVGVNLMANTSVLGLALPLAPITLLFGAGVTFVLIDTIALAGTAAAWYFILSRHVVTSRAAAWVGGLFCGFAPSMISQSTGHPNIAGQFLIPFIVWNVFRLREPGPTLRRGLVLGAVVLYQCFINEEILFLTAVAMTVFLLVYLHPREYLPAVRAALPAVLIGAAAAGVLLAWPLYHQFFGPQAYRGLPDFVHTFSSDLGSFHIFSRRSILAPEPLGVVEKMGGATEENTFFGLPLLGLILAGAIGLWRRRAARALLATALVFAALSLGTVIRYNGRETTHNGPWKWVHELPLFDSVVPTRLALAIAPLLGVLIAMLVDRFVVGVPAATAAGTGFRFGPAASARTARVAAGSGSGAGSGRAADSGRSGGAGSALGDGAGSAPRDCADSGAGLGDISGPGDSDGSAAGDSDGSAADDSAGSAPGNGADSALGDSDGSAPGNGAGPAAGDGTGSDGLARDGGDGSPSGEHDPVGGTGGTERRDGHRGVLVAESSALPETSEGARGANSGSEAETTPAARWLWAAALLIALVPLIPTPQPAAPRPPIPAFFSSGAWRGEIPENGVVVTAPLGWYEGLDAMRWSTAEGLDFRIAGGYFLIPNPDDPRKVAQFNAPTRPTMQILSDAAGDGTVPQITPAQRAQAEVDVAFWQADVILVPEGHNNADAVRQTADQLFGPGKHVADVWLWKVGH